MSQEGTIGPIRRFAPQGFEGIGSMLAIAVSLLFALAALAAIVVIHASIVTGARRWRAILTELGGFPGVSWDYVPAELRKRFADIIPQTIPTFPAGKWETAINDGWYRNVAPNVDRKS